MPKTGATELTQRQEDFCLHFVQSDNASEAYRKAFDAPRASAKSINERASRLMATDKIKARIEEIRILYASGFANRESFCGLLPGEVARIERLRGDTEPDPRLFCEQRLLRRAVAEALQGALLSA